MEASYANVEASLPRVNGNLSKIVEVVGDENRKRDAISDTCTKAQEHSESVDSSLANMGLLGRLPPELRNVIYRDVLSSPTGLIQLKNVPNERGGEPLRRISPSEDNTSGADQLSNVHKKRGKKSRRKTPRREQSTSTMNLDLTLAILKTCRKINEECKDLIWQYNEVLMYYNECACGRVHQEAFGCKQGSSLPIITGLIQRLRLIIDPKDLVAWIDCRILSEFKSLQSFTLILGGTCYNPSPESIIHPNTKWNGILPHREMLLLVQDKEMEEGYFYRRRARKGKYSSMLDCLDEIGGVGACLSRIERKIVINTGASTFNFLHKDRPYAERLLSSYIDPEEMMRQMNLAFGGELWVDGFKCYQNGESIKPATVSLGTISDGLWLVERPDFEAGREEGSRAFQVIGNRPTDSAGPTAPNTPAFQYERDLAQLFVTLTAAKMTGAGLETAMKMVRQEALKKPFPPFLRTMNRQQKNAVISFAKNAIAAWDPRVLGDRSWVLNDTHTHEQQVLEDIVDMVHEGCLNGVQAQLEFQASNWVIPLYKAPWQLETCEFRHRYNPPSV